MNKRKIASLAALLVTTAAGIVIAMVVVNGSDRRKNSLLETIKPGEVIAKWEEDRSAEKYSSLSPQDSLKTIEQAAASQEKRIAAIRTAKSLLADEEFMLALLPGLNGWHLDNPQYHKGGYGKSETADLIAKYIGPGADIIEIELIDFIEAPAALQPLKMIFNMQQSELAEKRNSRVSLYEGNPVLEEYNTKTKERQFSAIIKNRFQLKLKSSAKNSSEILQHFTKELFIKK